ncbi:hypothetical protein HCN44_006643 [Aphidius gifuensis]|uniref:FIP-RBD domain-containing protein n=1 Tax=Aphidius gifuensis TaxID=684658 RepID=A0A834Y2W2_APHGI|nr:rab11 family-interacting protein 4 [Aphidius gifuensis]KAF7995536.1 hypothetical protein HCN44_006643 [Aphidius gifuensis]
MVISQYTTEQCSVSSSGVYETNSTSDIDEINRQNITSTSTQLTNNNNDNNASSDNLIKSINDVNKIENIETTNIVGRKLVNIKIPSTGCKSQSGPPSLSTTNDDLENNNNSLTKNTSTNNNNNSNKFQEESYEGFGYARVDADIDTEIETPNDEANCSTPSPTNGLQSFGKLNSAVSPSSTLGRHTWLRTSLRKAPSSLTSGRSARQLGSNALASQLYRSGSFNSSGRGSTCDATDDMYSDVSLEDDVMIDLNHRVRMIQEQMDNLVDTQSVSGERYARVKEENATLQARILMLEEAAKDTEARADEKLQSEQRRHREWTSRIEREKQLQLENCAMKIQTLEIEIINLREQLTRIREQYDSEKKEKIKLENLLDDANTALRNSQDNEKQLLIKTNEMKILLDTAKDELTLKNNDRQRIESLLLEVANLNVKNKNLEESRDELQAAAAALHAGRELLMMNPLIGYDKNPKSLAAELTDELDGELKNDTSTPRTIGELEKALKEQQDVNAQLKGYIDNILLNIVENYPHLLEVKQPNL